MRQALFSCRYLRSSEDFLSTQLSLLPLRDLQEEFGNNPNSASSLFLMKSMSWLLKTVAIELKLVCSNRLRSQVCFPGDIFLRRTKGAYFTGYTFNQSAPRLLVHERQLRGWLWRESGRVRASDAGRRTVDPLAALEVGCRQLHHSIRGPDDCSKHAGTINT